MRISDWSSDVCSSDLKPFGGNRRNGDRHLLEVFRALLCRDHDIGQAPLRWIIRFRLCSGLLRCTNQSDGQCECRIAQTTSPMTIPVRDPLHYFRSEEHTSELQSLMRNSYAVFCLKKYNNNK